MKRIKLYTCGHNEMKCSRDSVWWRLRDWYNVEADFVLDATVFNNDAVTDVGKCTGEHVAILKEMCHDTKKLDEFFSILHDLGGRRPKQRHQTWPDNYRHLLLMGKASGKGHGQDLGLYIL